MLRKERTTITPSSCRPRSVGRDVQGGRERDWPGGPARALSGIDRYWWPIREGGRRDRARAFHIDEVRSRRRRSCPSHFGARAALGGGRPGSFGSIWERAPRGGGGRKGTTKWQDLFHEHIIAAMMVKGREKRELIPGRHPTSTVSSRLHMVTSFAEPRYRRVIATGVPMV